MKGISVVLIVAIMMIPAEYAGADAIDRAFSRMYDLDFDEMHSILDEYVQTNPEDPMAYSTRAIAFLFSELYRMKILHTEFFTDDDQVTDKKKIEPDYVIRAKLFMMTREAREKAEAILNLNPDDRKALFALCMATGVETDYTILIEKKYRRSFSMSKESQKYARRLLAMDPPVKDAHLTLGMVEYVVSNLNWFFRLFVRFHQIEGSRQKAIENLNEVVQGGRYYVPLAKILLSVIYLREDQPERALVLMKEMQRDFPENPLIQSEVKKISEKVARKSQ